MDSISTAELFMLAVKPIALEIHSGKGPDHKYDVYKELTDGQRAAFMFWVLYSHAPDEVLFYTWVPYMRQPKPDYWNQLRVGMKLIECTEVLLFMDKCEEVFSVLEKKKSALADFKMTDLEDTILKQEIQKLFIEFWELAPRTIEIIGIYIKNHANDFLRIITNPQVSES